MKKLLTFSILTYLLFTINSGAISQSLDENNKENDKPIPNTIYGLTKRLGECFNSENFYLVHTYYGNFIMEEKFKLLTNPL